jgi:hypothetical protein
LTVRHLDDCPVPSFFYVTQHLQGQVIINFGPEHLP